MPSCWRPPPSPLATTDFHPLDGARFLRDRFIQRAAPETYAANERVEGRLTAAATDVQPM